MATQFNILCDICQYAKIYYVFGGFEDMLQWDALLRCSQITFFNVWAYRDIISDIMKLVFKEK